MAQTADVLIVGGGPAGLAAGIALARAGVAVLLCEQQTFPVDKACGEGLMPTGVQHLRQLGVILEDGFPLAGVRYHAPDGCVAAGCFGSGAGLGIRRTALSCGMLYIAQQHRTLRILENARVHLEKANLDGIDVRVRGERLSTRLLIGADGLHSPVRRWSGLERRGRRHWRWGARQHYRIAPWSDHVEVHWSALGIEAYVTPVAADEVGVAFLWQRDRYKAGKGRSLLPSLWAAFPELARQLQDAPAVTEARAIGPLQQRSRAVIAGGILLLGDAAGYLDAITGEGLSLAFAQALALEETVLPAIQASTALLRGEALLHYQEKSNALMRPGIQVTELALLLSRYPRLCNRVIHALRQDPTLFERLLSANMGMHSPWQVSTVARLATGLVRTLPEAW